MKKKVLLLANHGVYVYNLRKEIIQVLIGKGYEVYLSYPKGESVSYFEDMGCTFIDTKFDRHGTNPISEIKLIRHYLEIMKKVKPDVVLTYTIKPNIYGGIIASLQNIPYIANVTGLGSAVENGGLLKKITLLLYKFSFRKIQTIFFQNTKNQQLFINEKIALSTHKIIPGSGVNINEFKIMPYPDDTTIRFLYVGRVMKEKGIDEYLEAATSIKKKNANTEFHIIGFCEENYEDKLNELQEKGIIKYHGMQKDVISFHRTSHCTILPSYHEGMSNVLLESAASARPVITTNISGCKEIVNDKETGFIFQLKKPKDLISKIENFLILSNEEKKSMGLAGRKKIEKEFNREIVITEYMNEIENILRT